MFTEAPFYIMHKYGLSKAETIALCKTWRENFNEAGNYDEVNEKMPS